MACDLVLLSWNHLEETRPCLESLFATTRVPSRLLIVDNGSDAPVREFLAGVRPQGAITDVVLLQNETNEGFPKGMNRGIRASRAPYVVLLNNDLRFTPGWLDEMVAVAAVNQDVGVVNPGSSTFGDVPARGVSLDEHAAVRAGRRGTYTEVGMCIGFCMLIKRSVLDRTGGLSEEVERIFFEDEDFCMRAQRAGFRCVVAEGAYVFHAEHKTVKKMPEREALFRRNQRWCDEKWGRRIRIAWPQRESGAPESEELKAWLARVLAWARRRTHVYVFAPLPSGLTPQAMMRSVGQIPHADIHWMRVPARGGSVAAAARVLKRRKKRYDVIAAPGEGWVRAMRLLRWAHGAEVVRQDDEAGLTAAWARRSR
ncbi:MAG TPA: glycosyltransferase family 2 protein [bacterium]